MNERIDDAQFDEILRQRLRAGPGIGPIPGLAERAVAISRGRRRFAEREIRNTDRVFRRRVFHGAASLGATIVIAGILIAGHRSFAGLFEDYSSISASQSTAYSANDSATNFYFVLAVLAGTVILAGLLFAVLENAIDADPHHIFYFKMGLAGGSFNQDS